MAMGRSGNVFAHSYKLAKGSATMGAAILAATDVPASGSYVDVSGYERVHILCHLGAINASDSPTLEPKCADAVDGTADVIVADSLKHTPAVDDDNEWVVWTIEVKKLPLDHHFLTMDIGGTTSNGSYADIIYLLEGLDTPVTQTTAILPSASQYIYAG